MYLNEEFEVSDKLGDQLQEAMIDDGLINDDGTNLSWAEDKESYGKHLVDTAANIMDVLKGLNLTQMVNMDIYETPGRKHASIDVNSGKLSLFLTRDPDSMFTTSEVFMHEMIHLFTEHALSLTPGLRQQLRSLQEQVASEIDYTVFLSDQTAPTTEDVELAKQMYDYAILGNESEFMAYMMTNKNLIDATKNIKVELKLFNKFDSNTGFSKLINTFIGLINKIYSTIKLNSTNASDATQNLTNDLIQLQAKQMNILIAKKEAKENGGKFSEGYDKFDKFFKKHNTKFGEKLEKLAKTADKGLKSSSLLSKITELNGLRQIKATGLFQDVYNEITMSTTGDKVAGFYDLFRLIKKTQESDKEAERAVIQNMIHTELQGSTENERKAAKRVLVDTDVSFLLKNGYTMSRVAELLSDKTKLQAEVDKFRARIGNKTVTGRQYLEHAEGLGYYMVHGESSVLNQAKNAQNIYNGFSNNVDGATYSKLDSNPEQMIKDIETLATLYGLKYSGQEDIDLTVKAIKDNASGLKTVLNMYDKFNEDSYNGLFLSTKSVNDVDYRIKGYSKASFDDSMDVKTVKESDVQQFRYMGMEVVREIHNPGIETGGQKMFLMVGTKIDPTYHKGAIDIISFDSKGTSMRELIKTNGNSDAFAEEKINEFVQKNKNHRASGKELNITPESDMKLLPKFNGSGKIVDFATEMSTKEKIEVMTMNNDIAEVISNTMTNSIATASSIVHNLDVIKYLVNDAQQNYASNPEEFMVIEPSRPGFKSKTEEQWKMIPERTREDIYSLTKESKLIVRRALVNDIIGYKSFSIADIAFLKKHHPKVARAIAILEDGWLSIVTKFKGIIVTMTGSVVLANMVSNMMFAWQHGVNPIKFAKHSIDAWKLIEQYEQDSSQLETMKLLKMGGQVVSEKKMKALEAKMENNKMHELIEQGMFTPIVDDVNVAETRQNSTIDKQIDKVMKKLPKQVRTGMDYLYLNEKTPIYKMMLKLIQYGDISARYAVLEEAKKKDNFDKKAMFRYLDEMLVNYSYNENRLLRYANDVGLFMFSKYFFRTPKAIYKMMKRSPTFAAMFQGAQMGTGIDVVDPLDTYHDIFGAFANRISNPFDIVATIIEPHIFAPITDLGTVIKTS